MSGASVLDREEIGAWATIDLDGTIRSPSRLSYSAVSDYSQCGEYFRLTRGFRQPSNSWWANPGGGAIHEMTELHDTGQEVPPFEEVFEKQLEDYKDVELLPSGKKGLNEYSFAGGPEGKDRGWWLLYGPMMFEAYVKWRSEQTDYMIIGVEHELEQVVGGELMIGSIDRVEIHVPSGKLGIRDIKTGDGGYLQLAGYREGYFRETGMLADWGDLIKFRPLKEKRTVQALDADGKPAFYQRDTKTAKRGDPKMEERTFDVGVECYTSRATDFTGFTSEYVENIYEMARRGIEAGVFMPNQRNNCRYCGVNEYCRSYGGDKGLTYPVKSKITSGKASPVVAAVVNQ